MFNLMGGHVTKCSRSCGRRGLERTPEQVLRAVWSDMRKRCLNPAHPKYGRYGGRGIRIDSRWESFAAFAEDMGPRPAGHSIERRDNDGDYTPENCVWLPTPSQAANKSSTRFIEAGGLRLNVTQWALRLGVCTRTIRRWADSGELQRRAAAPERNQP